MASAYAWLKLAPFHTALAGVLSVEGDRVRYEARSDDERSRRFVARKFERPELVDQLAGRDGVTLLDCATSDIRRLRFPASQMGGGVTFQTPERRWRFLFYEPPVGAGPEDGGEVLAKSMLTLAKSVPLRRELKRLQ